ncbi:MAG: hypothetical protein QOE99_1294 [Actinomycetota bacterium]|jgi:hypothetical protein|nr:hypothetical protein [Actinomycetota bacterium]
MTTPGRRPSFRRAALPLCGALLALALPLGLSTSASAAPRSDTPGAPPVPAAGGPPSLTMPPVDLTPGTQWYAGGASESINPTQAMIDTGKFYLGGFGFGSGKTLLNDINSQFPQYDSGRAATGVLPGSSGPSVRAMAIGDGKHALVTAQIETQGYFLAYKNGDYGIIDIRREAAAQIAQLAAAHPGVNALPARSIVIDSNHSHGGPDTAGVWGGVPTEPNYHGDMDYLLLVKNRTVKAIVDAWKSLQPVDLYYGDRPAGIGNTANYPYPDEPANFDRLMNNQYDDDPANHEVDDQVRVIRATKPGTQTPVLTYVNFSAHADVLGSNNLLATGDYSGPLSELLAKDGGVGFAQVGTLGREQPNRGSCPPAEPGELQQVACLRGYAARVDTRVDEALAKLQPVTGPKLVALSSYFLTDVASNALIMGLDYGGFAAGLPLLRAETPPWETGNVMGTTMFSGRIGDLVISGNPGEPYPQILAAVSRGLPHKQGYFSIGTAGDFLGYIIYPFTAYPEPIRRSILDGGPPPQTGGSCGPAGCPNPIGNDNFFFNVSQTFGQRLVCAELRGVKQNFTEDTVDVNTIEPQCAAFTQDGALPPGWETQFSSTGLGASDPAPGTDVPEAPYAALLALAALLAFGGVIAARRRAG